MPKSLPQLLHMCVSTRTPTHVPTIYTETHAYMCTYNTHMYHIYNIHVYTHTAHMYSTHIYNKSTCLYSMHMHTCIMYICHLHKHTYIPGIYTHTKHTYVKIPHTTHACMQNTCVCLCVHMCRHRNAMMCVWRSADNLQMVLSFHHVGSGIELIFTLGGK